MTDEKYVFVADLREKKSAAYGGRHKKGGSKSKKCTMPSDYLTPAQKRKMNGEVVMYKIGQPISWQEFKSYPQDIQQEWIDRFYEMFGCCSAGLSLLWGKKVATIGAWMARNDLKSPGKGRLNEMSKRQIMCWIGGKEEEPVVEENVEEKVEEKGVDAPYFADVLKGGRLCLEGDANEICQTLYGIFRNKRVKVDVRFTEADKEEV